VLLTTQYLEEADQLADHSVVIDRGQVIASVTSAELKARLGSDLIEIEVRAAELDQATAVAAPCWSSFMYGVGFSFAVPGLCPGHAGCRLGPAWTPGPASAWAGATPRPGDGVPGWASSPLRIRAPQMTAPPAKIPAVHQNAVV
jgi:hypothetical protein